MIGVNLIGKEAVLRRYNQLDSESWALYQGKQFIVGGTGVDRLDDWLEGFAESGSTATYSLRVYDGNEVPTSGTGNDDYRACINFKVVDGYEGKGINGHGNALIDRIKGLELKIDKMGSAEADDNDEGGIGAIVTDWLQNPQKLAVVFGIAKQIFMGGGGEAVVAPALQTISGMGNNSQSVQASTPEGLERLSKALDILGVHDADLVVHMEKLATLAQNEPLMFKAIIGRLDGL